MRVPSPVGVGTLDRDFAFDDVAVQEGSQFLGEVLLNPEGDVVEIDEECCVRGVYRGLTQMSPGPDQRFVHVSLVLRIRRPVPIPRSRCRICPGRERRRRARSGCRMSSKWSRCRHLPGHPGLAPMGENYIGRATGG